jgi:hypothetical protein
MTEAGKNNKGWYMLLGIGALLTSGLAITGLLVYNHKQRQANFDYLISVIDADLSDFTDANAKGSAFDKDAYKTTENCTTIDPVVASNDAATLYNAIGYITNDYEGITTVLKSMSSKCDLQQVSDRFYTVYNTDLLTYLKNGMTDDHLQQYVLNYTKVLT